MSTVAPARVCACGQPATANGRECPPCYRERLGSVTLTSAPPMRAGASGRDPNVRWQRRLDDYARTRAEGIQPSTTRQQEIDDAKRVSDEMGTAFRGDLMRSA